MYRPNATPNSRTLAGALSALAVAIGAILFTAAPAKADHFEFGFFFAPPVPIPIPLPVFVQHEVVYEQPRVVYERPVVYERYYQPTYYGYPHRHHKHCHHGDGYRRGAGGYSGRGDWDDHDRGESHYQRDVGYRGRY
jgi:hypothetical protein